MGSQRTQLVRKPFGKHRHGAVHQIDRRAALHGLVVDHRVGPHVMGHVGDVHAHFPDAVLYFAHRQRVVEVLGVRGIDREGRDTPEVAPLGDLFGRDAGVDGLGGLLDFGFEAVGKLVFRQDRVHPAARPVRPRGFCCPGASRRCAPRPSRRRARRDRCASRDKCPSACGASRPVRKSGAPRLRPRPRRACGCVR